MTKLIKPIDDTFIQIPNWLVRRTEVSNLAKIVYGRLSQYAGNSFKAYPYQTTLAFEVGISERQLRRILSELVSFGLIKSDQRGKKQSNFYYFLDHEWKHSDQNKPKSDRTEMTGQEKSDRTEMTGGDRTEMTAPYENNKRKYNNKISYSSLSSSRARVDRERGTKSTKDTHDQRLTNPSLPPEEMPFKPKEHMTKYCSDCNVDIGEAWNRYRIKNADKRVYDHEKYFWGYLQMFEPPRDAANCMKPGTLTRAYSRPKTHYERMSERVARDYLAAKAAGRGDDYLRISVA